MKIGTTETVPMRYIGTAQGGTQPQPVWRPMAAWLDGKFIHPYVNGTVISNLASASMTDANVLENNVIHCIGTNVDDDLSTKYEKFGFDYSDAMQFNGPLGQTYCPNNTGWVGAYSKAGALPVSVNNRNSVRTYGSFTGKVCGIEIADGYSLSSVDIWVVLCPCNMPQTIAAIDARVQITSIASGGNVIKTILTRSNFDPHVGVYHLRTTANRKFWSLPIIDTHYSFMESRVKVFFFYGFEAQP